MNRDYRHTIARWYYFGTPVFILLDYLAGINVRVAVLDSMPLYKNLYYAFCIICAVGIYIFPRYSAVVALFESMIIFLMTVLVLLTPYIWALTYVDDVLSADWEAVHPFSMQRTANLFLAAFIAVLVFRRSLSTLEAGFGSTEQAPNDPPESDAGEPRPR